MVRPAVSPTFLGEDAAAFLQALSSSVSLLMLTWQDMSLRCLFCPLEVFLKPKLFITIII